MTLLKPTGYVILYPLSFAEDNKLRPGEVVTSIRQCQNFAESSKRVRSKMADLQVVEIKKRTHRTCKGHTTPIAEGPEEDESRKNNPEKTKNTSSCHLTE